MHTYFLVHDVATATRKANASIDACVSQLATTLDSLAKATAKWEHPHTARPAIRWLELAGAVRHLHAARRGRHRAASGAPRRLHCCYKRGEGIDFALLPGNRGFRSQ